MTTDILKKYFREPTMSYLRNFILDNKVSDTDSIALEQRVFDELALDFRHTYKEPIPIPFIFLGVWIKIADRSTVRSNEAIITENELPPLPINNNPEQITRTTVYRCGFCGSLIDEYGYGLIGEAYEIAIKRWKTFGESIFIPAVGKCCENKSQ